MSSRRRSHSSSSEDSSDINEKDSHNKFTNVFRNDGSFLEMFKKMQKASQLGNTSSTSNTSDKNLTGQIAKSDVEKDVFLREDAKQSKPVPIVRRRKCNKALPVGKVKKLKADEEQEKKPAITDAWAKYLEEVKKYKETSCDSETKNRSLVK